LIFKITKLIARSITGDWKHATKNILNRTGGEMGMTQENVVKITDTFVPDAFQRFENEWSPEQEIVRCKDCKYRTKRTCNNIELWECNHIRYELAKCGVTDDWFCADGEREEGR
jgi:hypothetical protein